MDDVAYAELHCRSNYSFLSGASSPKELVDEAVRLGLKALAITDLNGFYGIVRFAEAAKEHDIDTIFGAELDITINTSANSGTDSNNGAVSAGTIVVLARGHQGYRYLSRAISVGQFAGSKGKPRLTLSALVDIAVSAQEYLGAAPWVILTGAHDGIVTKVWKRHGPQMATHYVQKLVDGFGKDNVFVELWDHGDPTDSTRNDQFCSIALDIGIEVVACNAVLFHNPDRFALASALAAISRRETLDEADYRLAGAPTAHLRSAAEQARWFYRYPGSVQRSAHIASECAFDLSLVSPKLPPFPCPDGLDEMSYLRHLVEERAPDFYGQRPKTYRPHCDSTTSATADAAGADTADADAAGVVSDLGTLDNSGSEDPIRYKAWGQIEHELNLISQLDFPGYFLIVYDIVEFCKANNIFCQGRGSAANSAVCYVLGITKADAVRLNLLFERFLSPERDGPPDIDIDIESGRREEVIQYVYETYGRHHAAQVANVITYRSRSAVRDMARALGYSPGQQDAFAKEARSWARRFHNSADLITSGPWPDATQMELSVPLVDSPEIPDDIAALTAQLRCAPRHLGIHVGGMVICDRPIIEVCPVEWANMKDRSVLQWDKDDCAAAGLVKFDLLGLGMLTALHLAVDMIRSHCGIEVDLAKLEQDPKVYDMLCRADTIGVFQVESRAQMATLPRLKPRTFYDLVVEVALIRPGPIQGGSVHPYIRRRNGEEPVTYLHPLLENALKKTLGVPLFQEQLMQMAIDVAGFSAAEADALRSAMGSKRSEVRMAALRERFYNGMAERGITGGVADEIWDKLSAFSSFGFPESHSISFAYLVYSSAWIKCYYPAAFCASLLNAQPMGFYSPHTLVADARRAGVVTHRAHINRSLALASLEGSSDSPELRLGLSSIRSLGSKEAEAIQTAREVDGVFTSIADLGRRVPLLNKRHLESLATAGALSFDDSDSAVHEKQPRRRARRREDLWAAGAVAKAKPDQLPNTLTGVEAPRLFEMSEIEEAHADLYATGIAIDGHPTRFLRDELDQHRVTTASDLLTLDITESSKVRVAGVVTHRQRPATAGGVTFINLEDETGLINVVVSQGCWIRHQKIVADADALYISGRLERVQGVVNVIAERIWKLPTLTSALPRSRNFR